MKVTRALTVTIEAKTAATADDMVEALARSACDIANSTEDDDAHILMDEVDPTWDDSAGDHPVYTMPDWVHEVSHHNTRLGYAQWVGHKLEEDSQ